MYDLGHFLIYTTRNIKEGLELVDKSIRLLPDFQWYFLEGKGLGLYKQGKYKEALELLEKYWQSIHIDSQNIQDLSRLAAQILDAQGESEKPIEN